MLRLGPQDLPASQFLMVATLVTYAVVEFIATGLAYSVSESLLLVGLDVGLVLCLVWLALRWRGFASRFNQTVTALFGTGTLLGLVSIPIVSWLVRIQAQIEPVLLPVFLWFGLFIWTLVVMGHILRQALSVSFVAGVLLAVGYMLVSVFVTGLFFPSAT